MKTCNKCLKDKELSEFSIRKRNSKHINKCKICEKKYNQQYYLENKNKIIARQKKYYDDFVKKTIDVAILSKVKIKHYSITRSYYITKINKDIDKKYDSHKYQKNKNNIKKRTREYYRNNKSWLIPQTSQYKTLRRQSDPEFKLRCNVSKNVLRALKNNGSDKDGKSIIDYLPYSIKELRKHIESQFEYWMTWANHGSYFINKWDDNDTSTWTWHIDHIIPHSKFKYTSMSDESFKKCWALENLRPLSAKQNLIKSNKNAL
jgi:hypothetical protein